MQDVQIAFRLCRTYFFNIREVITVLIQRKYLVRRYTISDAATVLMSESLNHLLKRFVQTMTKQQM